MVVSQVSGTHWLSVRDPLLSVRIPGTPGCHLGALGPPGCQLEATGCQLLVRGP